jgi:hypothetical protein
MSAPADAGAACVHDWQPIMGWYARYRCAICHVIGHKPGAVHPQHARCTAITPYRCEVRCGGKRCAAPAVHSWRGKKLRCAAHVHSGRTAKARDRLAGEILTARQEIPAAAREDPSAVQQVLTTHQDVSTPAQQVWNAREEVSTASHQVSTAGHEVSSTGHEVSCRSHDVVTKEDA